MIAFDLNIKILDVDQFKHKHSDSIESVGCVIGLGMYFH